MINVAFVALFACSGSGAAIQTYLEGSVDRKLIKDIIEANSRYIPEDAFDTPARTL